MDVTHTWFWAVLTAALCGAVGGLTYELLITRFNDSGMLELPTELQPTGARHRRYADLGYGASIIIGAVASVSFLYFLPPETVTTIPAKGDPVVTRVYDVFKLIPAALLVGTGGPSFLAAMKERLLKVIAIEGQQQAVALADEQLKNAKTLVELVAADPQTAGKAIAQIESSRVALRASDPQDPSAGPPGQG